MENVDSYFEFFEKKWKKEDSEDRRLFLDRIYKIYTDFYIFLFTMFIPVNPVYFKLIYAIRTKDAVYRRPCHLLFTIYYWLFDSYSASSAFSVAE